MLLFFVVRTRPYTGDSIERIKVRALARTLAEVWDNPGTRLGLWVHFSTMFGGTVFVMLWGYPSSPGRAWARRRPVPCSSS